jgi:hypothetical protein
MTFFRRSKDMKSILLLWDFLMVLLLVGMPLGCKQPSAPDYVKVSGKVVDAQGKPVFAEIRFLPTENMERFKVGQNGMNYPLAIGNKDGTFALNMSGGDIEGAPPGKYRVLLRSFSNEQNQKIPLKYHDPDKSPLEVTIPNKDVIDLILKIE